MKKILFLLLMSVGTLSVATYPDAPAQSPARSARMVAARQWADSVTSTLSLREQIGQLVFPRLDIHDNAAGRQQLARMIEQCRIGGFLLGKGTLKDYKGLIDYGQSLSPIPLMVTLDGEWGLAMRVTDAPRFPHNMALGAVRDAGLLERYGAEVARECRSMGIHVNFAPVLDVNSNPSNPVIGYRSFGEEPERVAALGVAYSKGLEGGGVMSVAKHFPGHGDTSSDSHKTLPTVDHSAKTLREVDMVPFDRYIKAGMSGVMVGHLNVPALDPSGTPASLSELVTSDLLKGKMGFEGLVWTDALAMKGADSHENNCVRALKAGADVLLQPQAPSADIQAVVNAVEKGKISAGLIRERCVKVLTYKYLFVVQRDDDPAAGVGAVGGPQAESVNRQLSAAVVTVLRDSGGIIPLKDLDKCDVAVVSLGAKADNPFATTCRKYVSCELFGGADGSLSPSQLAKIRQCNTVIIGVFKQSAAVAESLKNLAACDETTAVCFVNPYRMAKMREALDRMDALVSAFDDTRYLEEAAAQVVFGGIGASGRLPVNLKGWMPAGTGIDTRKTRLGYSTPLSEGLPADLGARYDSMIRSAMKDGAFPGCQVLVAKNGNVVIDRSYGSLDRDGKDKVNSSTMYDVASVSKVAGVVSGLMKAYDEGRFRLTDTLGRFVTEVRGTPKGRLTMKQLLLHESGMPAMLSMYDVMLDTATFDGPAIKSRPGGPYSIRLEKNAYANKNARLRRDITSAHPTEALQTPVGEGVYVGQATFDTIMNDVFKVPLKGGEAYRYSDLNFVLLMAALESMEGRRLDEFVETEVFAPIGADRTMYVPLLKDIPAGEIAPTERDPMLRRQHLRGYVHDELAAFSGGVQGNAGIFSTAGDMAKLCQTWLQGGSYGGRQVFAPETVRLFTETRSRSGKRALGFDTAPPKSGAGSERSYGHTGFTGTQIKVDPDNDVVFVFLSNRVNPSRENAAFTRSDIRNRLWSAIYAE